MSDAQLRELFARHDPAAEPPLPPGYLAHGLEAARRRTSRRRTDRIAAGVAAVAALGVAGGLVAVSTGDGRPTSGTGRAGQQVVAEPADAATLLGRISLAAGEQNIAVRDDQFIYTRYQSDTQIAAKRVTGPSETWESVDGSRAGWSIGLDKLGKTHSIAVPPPPAVDLEYPTYKYLTTLSTDPDALLAKVRAFVAAKQARHGAGKVGDADQAAFDVLGSLIRQTLLPPKLGAAVYRAAAKIPGVTVVRDATDVVGRHGIAVARTSRDVSTMWIFDRTTYGFLGERAVSRSDETGSYDSNIAVVTRAVVDKPRQRP